MKKILKYLFCTILIFALLAPCAFATETAGSELLPPSETSPLPQEGGLEGGAIISSTETSAAITETTDIPTGSEETEAKIWDFISKEMMVDGIRWLVMILIYIVFNIFIFKKFNKTGKKQDDVTNAVNELIAAYDQMENAYLKMELEYTKFREAYAEYGKTEDDRNRVIGAVMELSAAMLEIMQFAYANSSKLPQGIKDVINLKYSRALAKLGDDKELIALVQAVRKNINATVDDGGESDE
jgi:hypothetical protein